MGFLKKGFLVIMLPLLAFAGSHKFYVSVTNIGYSAEDDALQITSRIFIDDLEAVLKERYDVEAKLATKDESENATEYIEKYLRAKFKIEVDKKPKAYEFLGKKYDNDLVICYIEASEIDLKNSNSIGVQNEILTDLFDEQQNVVHFKIDDKKKSFVLAKGRSTGMLKL